MNVPIAKIGELQRKDIRDSSGMVLFDEFARICTVTKPNGGIGDRSPYRMADMFGGSWQDYNDHYIIQVSGCPLDCRYCYVDNLAQNAWADAAYVVRNFLAFKRVMDAEFGKPLNALHFMGGAPGVYCGFWHELREELDACGRENVVLFSDVIFVEQATHGVCPWHYMDLDRFIVTGCLKGTNKENFERNTGKDLFAEAFLEMTMYLSYGNFYLTLLEYNTEDLPIIYDRISPSRVDLLHVVNYEATQAKMQTRAHA